jgi:8-oxo-dGTP pyrophosphatase MutT (NUDIX family)
VSSGSSSARAEHVAAALGPRLLDCDAAAEVDVLGGKDAAVLVPLFVGDDGRCHAVFTKRRDDLEQHAGEISFPGGRHDEDDPDLLTTALRESEEEIGLPAGDVEMLGALPPIGTFVTSYRVHPFVGLVPAGLAWTLQPTEVEVVLEFSLPALVAGHEMKRLLRKGVPIKTPTYTVDGELIWGATARIVFLLLERLAPVI